MTFQLWTWKGPAKVLDASNNNLSIKNTTSEARGGQRGR